MTHCVPFAQSGKERVVVEKLVTPSAIGNFTTSGEKLECRLRTAIHQTLKLTLRRTVIAICENLGEQDARDEIVNHRLIRIAIHSVRIEPTNLVGYVLLDKIRIASHSVENPGLLAATTEHAPVPRLEKIDLLFALGVGNFRNDFLERCLPAIDSLLRECLALLHFGDSNDEFLDCKLVSARARRIRALRCVAATDVHHLAHQLAPFGETSVRQKNGMV